MSYQVLARKWRPRNFAELVGQEHVVRALANGLDGGRLHHAFLFTGTRGVGKTTIARILAKCLNCEQGVGSSPCGECSACREVDEGRFVDLIEVDAASKTGVDETRELLENTQFTPARGRFKVYLIDEVHMFSKSSFNALLKTLEEPPEHVKFLLATTEPKKVPVTVLSRCLQFNLKRLPGERIEQQLERILEAEGVDSDGSARRLLARAADGSMRDALSLMDQAIAYGNGAVREAEVRAMLGVFDLEEVGQLLDPLAAGDAAALLARVDELATRVTDYADLLGEVLVELQRIALLQMVPDALDPEDRERLEGLAQAMSPEDVQLYYEIAMRGRDTLHLAPDPRGGFEMTLLRMLAFRPLGGPPAARFERSTASVPSAPSTHTSARADGAGGARVVDAESWSSIVSVLALPGLTGELAANCAFVASDEGSVRLRISVARAQLATDKGREKLEQALSAYCGRALRVRLDVEDGAQQEVTPALLREQRAQERQRDAESAVEQDANVKAICELFDATVDRTGIRPSES